MRIKLKIIWYLFVGLVLDYMVLGAAIQEEGLKSSAKRQRLQELIKRTDDLLAFFESDYNEVNVDGLYGIRIAEGSLIVASDESYYDVGKSEPMMIQRVDSLRKRLTELADKTHKSVLEQEPDYGGGFDRFLRSPSISNFTRETHILSEYKHMIVTDRSIENANVVTSFDESKSDACYMSLLDDTHYECKISSNCLDYYSDRRASAYFLTHQYLFLTVVDSTSCNEKILPEFLYHISGNDKAAGEIKEIFKRNKYSKEEDLKYALNEYFCSRIYEEVNSDAHAFRSFGYIPGGIDLFVERLLLCTMNNVKDFKSDEWLDIIYQYQLPIGCFGYLTTESSEPRQSTISLLRHRQSKNLKRIEELLNLLYEKEMKNKHRYTNNEQHIRMKRSEKEMGKGCLSHLSGLAIGYYATMIKVLLESF